MGGLSVGLVAVLLAAGPPVRVRVVDPAGAPVAGASVHASIWSGVRFPPNRDYATGPDGVAVVRRPAEVQILRLWVTRPGFAGLFRGWEEGTRPDGPGLPAEYTFRLTPATTAGGRVVDPAGNPVAGVRVEAMFVPAVAAPLPDGVRFSEWLAYGTDARRTDAAGRWSLANLPPPEAGGLALKLTHPDYVSDERWGEQQVSTEQLRAGTAVLRLARGARLSGTVTDPAGQPVAGAVVVFHERPYFNPGTQVRTDARGQYRLPPLKPGFRPLTIIAPGHAPDQLQVDVKDADDTADVQLLAGKPVRVRVVDPDGNPVRASFTVERWRGNEGLYSFPNPNGGLPTGMPTRADAAGLFRWDWAPADPVTFRVDARGFQEQTLHLAGGDEERTVTLVREVRP